jgi:maleate isomerase
VIGSNQASMWHCLRLAGVHDRMDGYGRLFREY